MNFLDAYGIVGAGTSTPPANDRPEQGLDEEVSQVIGTLGRFWGGFKKQGGAAFANARRDFSQVVTQAQREFGKLTTKRLIGLPTIPSTSSASTPQSFFARIRSSLPPNVVSAVQAHLPEGLKNAESIDLSQLRDTLSVEFQRVQGVTRAQAEEYVHKSEVILREAMREAGEVLRDAVKVIPPEEADTGSNAGLVWDGADVWMLPGLVGGVEGGRGNSKGKAKESDKLWPSNPEIIKVDPAVDSSKQSYLAWANALEASGAGFGTEAWSGRIADALSGPHDGLSLRDTLDSLVPSCMPEEVFWVRYFFRVHQIEQEENRRKALFQGYSYILFLRVHL
ncbi:hypothetical protein EDC04DRAFT_2631397 [Pisolithus marmoratus]|nr:hypothetical protein EDC04DRAFT_2631397 [Pisolithus marmoratus]